MDSSTVSSGSTLQASSFGESNFPPINTSLSNCSHFAGHYTIGGDPGGDFFASPGDPAFFLHHAQIDRTWWIWQNQDLANRKNAISGTITVNNSPPRNGTVDDWLEMGILGTGTEIKNTMFTTGGPLCYIYV